MIDTTLEPGGAPPPVSATESDTRYSLPAEAIPGIDVTYDEIWARANLDSTACLDRPDTIPAGQPAPPVRGQNASGR